MKPIRRTAIVSLYVLSAWLCLASSDATAAEEKLSISAQLVGGEVSYAVQKGDSLTSVGARFGVSTSVLAGSNGLSATAHLKEGQLLRVDNRHIVPIDNDDGILINIPQRMLFYFKAGSPVRAYPVALGKADWPTPTGRFNVTVKEENPVWDVPQSIQEEMLLEGKEVKTCVPPGPDNPLGKHWLGLSINGYGIHGTIAPASLFQFQTHGCIRLHADDIAELFNDVSRGTSGALLYHRLLVAKVGDQIFLEVHRDIYQKQPNIIEQFEQTLKTQNLDARVDWQLAKNIIRRQEGIAREISKRSRAATTYDRPSTPAKLLERSR
jgi:L,D-transpeptidase ErfK/SrfK